MADEPLNSERRALAMMDHPNIAKVLDAGVMPPSPSGSGVGGELVTILEGQMDIEIAGQINHPIPGDELLIPAGTLHSARNIGSTTARWLYGYKRK